MTDRDKKFFLVSNPQIQNDSIFADYLNKKSPTFKSARIPKRRLTMPEIMNNWKPCSTCYKTDQECPDRKENIVMCIGDKNPINAWSYATDRIIEIKNNAVQMGKSLEMAAKSCKDAAERFKTAFYNVHLGEPYQKKTHIDEISEFTEEHYKYIEKRIKK